MSFWNEDHPLQDKYEILWNKYVPSVGECYNSTAEAIRLVGGVYYQLHNNGSWYGTGNYHAEEYMKKSWLNSPADYFMESLKRDYDDSDDELEDNESLDEKCKIMNSIMGDVVDWAWLELADENDKKELRKRERKKKKLLKEETNKLKATYKAVTGKRFCRKKGANESPLEALRKIKVMHNGSLLSLSTIMSQQPIHTNTTPTISTQVAKFVPTVSKAEFTQYQCWQRLGRGPKPQWFMNDNTKASEIMNHYQKLEHYYK